METNERFMHVINRISRRENSHHRRIDEVLKRRDWNDGQKVAAIAAIEEEFAGSVEQDSQTGEAGR